MKEATGELNMTVVTLIAIAAIGAIFYVFVWPMIQRTIVERTCQTYGPNYHAVPANAVSNTMGTTEADVKGWQCCIGTGNTNCVAAN